MTTKKQDKKDTDNFKQSLHVGNKCAFGSWKLIWTDEYATCHMEDIPEKTAKALILAGMGHEG